MLRTRTTPAACDGALCPSLVAAALAVLAPAAWAAEAPSLLEEPFLLTLGTYVVESDTEATLNGSGSVGDRVNWEQTFGGGDVTRFRVDGQWRFADRHKLRALWFNSSRDGARTLDGDISWGGEIFPVDARVRGEANFDVIELAYEYSFLRRDTFEVSASAGLHYTEIELIMSARAETSNGQLQADIRESGSVGAPLPVLGLRGAWALPQDLWILAHAQFFALEIDDYDGDLQDYFAAVIWQPKRWLGVGIGYNRFTVDLDVGRRDFDGSLDWTYQGPMVFYSASF